MPFVIFDLVWVFLACIVLLITAMSPYLAKFISGIIGAIPIIGGYIADALNSSVDSAVRFLINSVKSGYSAIANLFYDHSVAMDQTNAAISQTASTAKSRSDYIQNQVVPNAEANAIGTAYAYYQDVETDLQRAEGSLQNNIDRETEALNAFENYVNGPLSNEINSDINQAEANGVSLAKGYTDDRIAALNNTLQEDLAPIYQAIASLQTTVAVTIPAELQQQAAAENAAIASAAQNQQALLQQAIVTINSEIAEAIANENLTVAAELEAQRSQLQGQLNNLQSLESIDAANIGSLETTTSITIPAAIAAVAVGVASITAEFEECAVTTCDGPNSISNVLNNILGEVDLAEMGNFLRTAISSPVEAAGSFATEAQGLYGGANDLLQSLLSL